MIKAPEIQVQNSPGGNNRSVPTFRGQDVQRVNMPLVNTNAITRAIDIADRNLFAGLAGTFSEVSADIYNSERVSQQQAEELKNSELTAQAKLAEMGEFITANTLFDISQSLDSSLDRITSEALTPQAISGSFTAAFEEQTEGLPPAVQTGLKDIYQPRLDLAFEEASVAQIEAQKNKYEENVYSTQERLERDIFDNALPASENQRRVLGAQLAQYKQIVNARTDLGPTEKQLKLKQFERELQEKTVTQSILTSSDYVDDAMSVIESQGVPESIKTTAFNALQRRLSLDSQLDARREKAEKDFIDSQATRLYLDAINNGDTSAPNKLAELARKKGDLGLAKQATDLSEYLENQENERFQESDPLLYAGVKSAILQGNQDPSKIEKSIMQYHGRGLSTSDVNGLLNDLEVGKIKLLNGPEYQNFTLALDAAFPDAGEPSQMDALTQVLLGDTIQAKDPRQAELQKQLKDAALVEVRQAVSDGQISGPDEFREYTRKVISSYKTTLSQTQAPEIKLSPTQLQKQSVARQDRRVRALLPGYEGNPKKVIEDMDNGLINEQVARKLLAAMGQFNGRE